MVVDLAIHVIRGRNLAIKDENGKADPYLKVKVESADGTVRKKKTSTMRKTLNPHFAQELLFPDTSEVNMCTATVYVEMWDWDRFTSNDFMGCLPPIHVPDLLAHPRLLEEFHGRRWYPLLPDERSFNVSGDVLMEIKFTIAWTAEEALEFADAGELDDFLACLAFGKDFMQTEFPKIEELLRTPSWEKRFLPAMLLMIENQARLFSNGCPILPSENQAYWGALAEHQAFPDDYLQSEQHYFPTTPANIEFVFTALRPTWSDLSPLLRRVGPVPIRESLQWFTRNGVCPRAVFQQLEEGIVRDTLLARYADSLAQPEDISAWLDAERDQEAVEAFVCLLIRSRNLQLVECAVAHPRSVVDRAKLSCLESRVSRMCQDGRGVLLGTMIIHRAIHWDRVKASMWVPLIPVVEKDQVDAVRAAIDCPDIPASHWAAAAEVAGGLGRKDILQVLLEKHGPEKMWRSFALACAHQHMEVVEWLLPHYVQHPRMSDILQRSSQHGLHQVVHAITKHCPDSLPQEDERRRCLRDSLVNFIPRGRRFCTWKNGRKYFTPEEKKVIRDLKTAYEQALLLNELDSHNVHEQGQMGQCIYILHLLSLDMHADVKDLWHSALACPHDRHVSLVLSLMCILLPSRAQLDPYLDCGDPGFYYVAFCLQPSDLLPLLVGTALQNSKCMVEWAPYFHLQCPPTIFKDTEKAKALCRAGLDEEYGRAFYVYSQLLTNRDERLLYLDRGVDLGDNQSLYERIRWAVKLSVNMPTEMDRVSGLFQLMYTRKAVSVIVEMALFVGYGLSDPLSTSGYSQAQTYLTTALDMAPRDGEALRWNGVAQERGMGVPVNKGKALEYYRRAYKEQYWPVCVNLGRVEKEPCRAFEYYQKGAEAGSGECMLELAVCYINALGTEEDHDQAKRWLTRACHLGVDGHEAWSLLASKRRSVVNK